MRATTVVKKVIVPTNALLVVLEVDPLGEQRAEKWNLLDVVCRTHALFQSLIVGHLNSYSECKHWESNLSTCY